MFPCRERSLGGLVDGPPKMPLRFPRLGKRKRALLGSNPPRNTQAVVDAMGRGVRANTMFDPDPTTVTPRFRSKVWASAGCASLETANTPLPFPLRGNIAETMRCLKKSRGTWGQSPQKQSRGRRSRGYSSELRALVGNDIARKAPSKGDDPTEERPAEK